MEIRFECQICGRKIKGGANGHRIAHHGYTRKWGWQSSSCPGARYMAYEFANDRIPAVIREYRDYIDKQEAIYSEMLEQSGKYNVYVNARLIEKDSPEYPSALRAELHKRRQRIASVHREIETLEKRFRNWTPKNPTYIEEKIDPDTCEASGTPTPKEWMVFGARRYQRCPKCGKMLCMTTIRGVTRHQIIKHKREK